MAAPRHETIQVEYQNPHAAKMLLLPVLVTSNTPEEELARNVTVNSARDVPWAAASAEHARPAILVGGGPSAADHLAEISALWNAGGSIFALNGASSWLNAQGITPDYQVIADAKENTAILVDAGARAHLFASQVHPATAEAAEAHGRLKLWHYGLENIELLFPPEKVARGDYVLIGGGAAVGNSALCLAYAMGHRDLHVFGFDSCHRDDQSHAYPQPMNDVIPSVNVKWAGKEYSCSVAMKWQAERFQVVARDLVEELGCKIHLYGDGLLQAMYLTPQDQLSEKEKYILMWQMDSYRDFSPGEHLVPKFIEAVKPDGLIIDFGCGTGRAGLALAKAGHLVILTDFADNCRDDEALSLPFVQCDLTQPIPLDAPYGFCTDVMEHIPPEDVETVIRNIMASAKTVFFQISTVPDTFGALIQSKLHLTVRSHAWWLNTFKSLDLCVVQDTEQTRASVFIVKQKEV